MALRDGVDEAEDVEEPGGDAELDGVPVASGVTVGDLNMLMGQTSAHKSKGKAAAAVAGSGSAGAVNAGAGAAVEPVGANAAYTAAATAAANNKVLNEGAYKVHLQHKATGQWFELQDLHVSETMPQLIGVSQAYINVWRRQQQ